MTDLQVRRIDWRPAWRIVPNYPTDTDLFERVAVPSDREAVIAVESLTNDRIRDENGEIQLVPPNERVSGPDARFIMAPFVHLTPEGSRFSDGTFGVFYVARMIDTAIEETKYHRARFMKDTRQLSVNLEMRAYCVDLSGALHDLRDLRSEYSREYDKNDYGASQRLARTLRSKGSDGIAWGSIRHNGGECAVAFRPQLLANCKPDVMLCYVWDGVSISDSFVL